MKGRNIPYSAEELAWIEERATQPRPETHRAFCKLFGRSDVSLTNFNALCKRNGWLTGRTGRFETGQTPPNKGKKMPYHPNSARTQFKKGHRGGKAAQNYQPIGAERITCEGYVERKIHDGLPMQSRWKAVHVINWQHENGPLPEAHCLKCVDGDRGNTAPHNWIAIPRALLPRLNGRWTKLRYDDAEPELKPIILKLAELKHAAREAQRGAQS